LVTGGAGFLGSHLCERLLGDGHEVICVDNLSTGREENLRGFSADANFCFEQRDICQPFDCGAVDYVFHFASPASPIDYTRLGLETLDAGSAGTRNCLELAGRHGARFLLASTSECYGDPEVHPQTEEYWGHVNPIGLRSVYDEAKRFAEALTMAYHRYRGLDTRIVRIFNTYGPRLELDDGRVISNFLRQALVGEALTIYGSGNQTRSFCYVTDLIEGIVRLAASGEHLPTNLGNPKEFTVLECARLVLEVTGSVSELVFEALPKDDPRQRCPEIAKARRLLDWEPKIDLRKGLELCLPYFHQRLSEMGLLQS
jgi:dTDP-glucose 4,6-dehydratase